MKIAKVNLIGSALVILCLFAGRHVKGQQIPFYCQYYINPFLYNPAATGTENSWNTYLVHRNQWSGFSGAPVTNALTLDGPIKNKKIGLGINLYNDVTGIMNRVGAYASYSYRMDLGAANRLYLGLSTGIISNQIDFSKQKLEDVTEGTVERQFDTKTVMDASFGLNYELSNLQIGFSIPQLMGNRLAYGNSEDTRSYYTLNRHYLGTLKYTFDISREKNITLYPLVLVRSTEGIPLQYDANVVLDWKKAGWFAVSYKSDYAVALNLGVRWSGLSVGYAYDIVTSPIAAYTGGSSEILVGYSFVVGGQETGSGRSGRSGASQDEYEKKMAAIERKLKALEEENMRDKELIDTLQDKLNRLNFDKDMVPQVGPVYRLKNVNFSMKSFELNKKSKEILDELVEFLNTNPGVKIDIHGHSDDVGEPENNMILSEKRAKAVYDYLVEKGIDAGRLSYKAFGETRLLVPDTDNSSRAVNRRTEFIILSK
jgi:type IX secretion system PorP/SprF family membrane protein